MTLAFVAPTIAALCVAGLTHSPVDPGTAARLEVRFVSAGGVVLVVEIDNRARGAELLRQASWTASAGGRTVGASVADAVPRRVLREVDRPLAPVGAHVGYGADGGLLLRVGQARGFQDAVPADIWRETGAADGPPLADVNELALSIRPREELTLKGDVGKTFRAPATLFGTRGAIDGIAHVQVGAVTPGLFVAALDGDELITLDVEAGEAFVADVARVCERDTPSALLLRPAAGAPGRLVAVGDGSCLSSGAVVVPMSGAWIATRSERPARAVLVWHPRAR